MDRDDKETIHNYAKEIYIHCTVEELQEVNIESITEREWKLDYDEERDRGINLNTYKSIIQTVKFMKNDPERYWIFDIYSFFEAYSFFPN
jgi:hypothetical protein